MNPMLLLLLIPLVQQGIRLAETLLKGKKRGPARKKVVLHNVMNAWNAAVASGLIKGEAAQIPAETVQAVVGMLIDSGVGILNLVKGGVK